MTTSAVDLAPVVELNDSKLSTDWQRALVEVRVDAELQMPARATLRFADAGYELARSSLTRLGTAVVVTDPKDTSVALIDGEVTAVAVDQPEGRQPELVLTALDLSHRLGRGNRVATYLNSTYSDIVKNLAPNARLRADVDPASAVLTYTLQVDSDLGLIGEMARRLGYDWWVSGRTLNFKKPAAGHAVGLALGKELLSFSARASGHSPGKVTVVGWDNGHKQTLTGSSSANGAGAPSSELAQLVRAPDGPFGPATFTAAGFGVTAQAEADDLSRSLRERMGYSAVTARGVTAGNGAIRLGGSVSVTGAGPLSGTYPVTKVEHVYRPGRPWTTRFVSGDRWPTGLVDVLGGGPRPNVGPGTAHPGAVVGVVTNINDPLKAGRVKVNYPLVSGEIESDWARLVAVGAGTTRGSVWIPEVRDEVLVAFEHGDPRQPIVVGGLYNGIDTIPNWDVADGKVASRSLTSRLGHVVTLMDGTADAQRAIELTLAESKGKLHLGYDGFSLEIPSGEPLTITVGNTKVAIGNDGALSLSAPSISLTAQQKISLQAPSVSVQGTATAEMKGAQVNVQADAKLGLTGGASVAVSGAIVQIN